MDPEYKKLIADNIDDICRCFKLTEKFWKGLESTKIFPKSYIDEIRQIKAETEDVKKRTLLIDLQRRPRSYQFFADLLLEVSNSNILNELCSAKNTSRYPFVSQYRGYCLILNNKEFFSMEDNTRHGSENDIAILRELFSQELHYHVDEQKNLTREEALKKLDDLKRNVDWGLYDSFIAIIMSHGVSNHVIASDAELVSYEEIWQHFIDDNCPQLMGKPKIFIFNCCRPVNKATPVSPHNAPIKTCKSNINDVFLMFSTLDNKYSVRDKNSGSFFAKSLHKAIFDNRTQDLSEISTKTNNILSQMIMDWEHKLEESQRIEYRTLGATKKFYFWS